MLYVKLNVNGVWGFGLVAPFCFLPTLYRPKKLPHPPPADTCGRLISNSLSEVDAKFIETLHNIVLWVSFLV